MPVLIDRGPLGVRLFAPTEQDRGKSLPEFRPEDSTCIALGVLNNMADLALEQTERQIAQLLDAAASNLVVLLRFYSLPGLQRGEWGQRHLKRFRYYEVDDLWDHRLDGLIVTGAEPRTADLRMEPYWRALTEVFDWAEDNTISTIASCLAVHAAVLYFDGINRQSLDQKCFGVFNFEKVSNDHLVDGLPPRFEMPHSRWNEIPEDSLRSAGYGILVRADRYGVDTFVKQKRSLFVFFQGHPEYEAWTLFGEYRRDIARFLAGEHKSYPEMPHGYFDQESKGILDAFRAKVLNNPHTGLMATFPSDQLAGKLLHTWRAVAAKTYDNWLKHMATLKAERAGRVVRF
jgi:homoserine O-succinyltransferase/O-acetyltransferase